MGRAAASSDLKRSSSDVLWQLAHPEQIGHLLEGGLAREVLDVVAAVGEPAPGAVEIAQLGFRRDHAFETADEVGAFSHA